jgi:anthranilate synthase component 2
MKVLVIDNYDSFVFNLVHIIYNAGVKSIDVVKNDKISLEQIEGYDKILLSPGPGIPKDAGLMPELIKHFAPSKSILGVCLGHQAIAENFGSKLTNLKEPLHGIASSIEIVDENYLFENCPRKFQIGHYHSWVIDENSLGKELEILAKDEKGNIMSIAHKTFDVRGVQFHPESILTEKGAQIISNWLNHN